jgi:hypothetical protein
MAYFPTIAIGVPFFRAFDLIDPDAQAFITAAGITNPTQQAAINRLVKNYKGIGDINNSIDLWTNEKAIYPFIGGTASTNKFNLKDSRDLDAAFRLNFLGGWTHSSTGSQPNGVNGYARCYLTPSIDLSNVNNITIGAYSRTATADLSAISSVAGCYQSASQSIALGIRRLNGNSQVALCDDGKGASVADASGAGYYSVSRTAINRLDLYRNGVSIANNTLNAVHSLPTIELTLGGVWLGAAIAGGTYSNKELAFLNITNNGISSANEIILYNIIQAFQTDLSRNI